MERNHMIENTLFTSLSFIFIQRALHKHIARSYLRWPAAVGLAGILGYTVNRVLFRPMLLSEIEDNDLSSPYFECDLDRDMMLNDVKDLGIRLKSDFKPWINFRCIKVEKLLQTKWLAICGWGRCVCCGCQNRIWGHCIVQRSTTGFSRALHTSVLKQIIRVCTPGDVVDLLTALSRLDV